MRREVVIIVLFMFLQTAKAQIKNMEIVLLDTIAEKEFLLIDVRTPEEYAEGYISGAINIDFESEDFVAKMTAIEKEKPIYLYCGSGNRSGQASEKLMSLGYKNIINLEGGFEAWRAADKIYMKDL